ncbi:MAG: hypothetical protein KBH11_12050 [Bacteroidia bacterium]|nr:hypothetical protein [Bacteroidota bacterium]MBP9083801.1 hypothetical protein [Bacteroidia bacterium]
MNQIRVKLQTRRHLNWQNGVLYAIIMPFFMVCFSTVGYAQQKLKAPVKLKIEDGDFEGVSVVVKNSTTGESNSLPGNSKLDLELKLNCEYVISFNKPGYITKKIALNTNSPGDRAGQGFYPFNFEVNLFKQYDGVNIVIFNQPVGKISYNRLIDDFDYDTDYTKQIQSALKAAEEEIKQKQREEQALAAQKKKEEEQKKLEDAALAKEAAKAKAEADKKAADEARVLAAQQAKDKKAEEERMKREAQAQMDEEKRRVAMAKMEEEERAKAKASEEEEARKAAAAALAQENNSTNSTGVQGNDTRPATPAGGGSESPPAGKPTGSGSENPPTGKPSGSGNDSPSGKPGKGDGDDKALEANAIPTKKQDKGVTKATGIQGEDEKPAIAVKEPPPVVKKNMEPAYEQLPDISVEEITEANRTIKKVTVRKNEKETIFSKVVYKWGGIFYFKNTTSISESLFLSATGQK